MSAYSNFWTSNSRSCLATSAGAWLVLGSWFGVSSWLLGCFLASCDQSFVFDCRFNSRKLPSRESIVMGKGSVIAQKRRHGLKRVRIEERNIKEVLKAWKRVQVCRRNGAVKGVRKALTGCERVNTHEDACVYLQRCYGAFQFMTVSARTWNNVRLSLKKFELPYLSELLPEEIVRGECCCAALYMVLVRCSFCFQKELLAQEKRWGLAKGLLPMPGEQMMQALIKLCCVEKQEM